MSTENIPHDISYRHNLIWTEYGQQRAELEQKLKEIAEIRDKKIEQLEHDCVRIHGGHLDNGGYLMGFCVRCKTCLE